MMPDTTFSYAQPDPTFQERLAEFFSFEGRIGRQQYWLRSLLIWAVNMVIIIPTTIAQNASTGVALGLSLVAIAVYLVVFWASLATTAKRLHDRGRSGWFMLIALIPLVGLWLIVEAGFLRGDESPNQYGDPVA